MNSISTDLKTLVPGSTEETSRQRRGHRSSRRKRSRGGSFENRVERMLRSPRFFHVGLVLFLLIGFVHVSLLNDVLGLREEAPYTIPTDRVASTGTELVIPDTRPAKLLSFYPAPSDDFPESEVIRGPDTESEPVSTNTSKTELNRPVANTWVTQDLKSLSLLSVKQSEVVRPDRGDQDQQSPASSVSNHVFERKTTYVINEGGSLWRTGKRFMTDEALLDRFIDSLKDSGMNVGSVQAGLAFTVHDLGDAGMQVVVNEGSYVYESRILNGGIKTTVTTAN